MYVLRLVVVEKQVQLLVLSLVAYAYFTNSQSPTCYNSLYIFVRFVSIVEFSAAAAAAAAITTTTKKTCKRNGTQSTMTEIRNRHTTQPNLTNKQQKKKKKKYGKSYYAQYTTNELTVHFNVAKTKLKCTIDVQCITGCVPTNEQNRKTEKSHVDEICTKKK